MSSKVVRHYALRFLRQDLVNFSVKLVGNVALIMGAARAVSKTAIINAFFWAPTNRERQLLQLC